MYEALDSMAYFQQIMRPFLCTLLLLLLPAAGSAAPAPSPFDPAPEHQLLRRSVWPSTEYSSVRAIGTGTALVFTPDLTPPLTCELYRSLGFTCFREPDWKNVVAQIARHNSDPAAVPIRVAILESHGTNGNGLKLQMDGTRTGPRSYASIGALQELLEPAGVRYLLLSACNSGRLLRPSIYGKLNSRSGDKLFLPATLGVLNASESFNPENSSVRVVRRAESELESLTEASLSEFSPGLRKLLMEPLPSGEVRFVISDMLLQLILGDDRLRLTATGHSEQISTSHMDDEESDRLFTQLIALLERVGAAEVAPDACEAPGAPRVPAGL